MKRCRNWQENTQAFSLALAEGRRKNAGRSKCKNECREHDGLHVLSYLFGSVGRITLGLGA